MLLIPGQLVNNRYRILRLLGQGGMGAVYLAEDGNLPGREVALKENSDSSQSAQDQFKREAVILARLKHPNLPQVTDHFVAPSGLQYLVMECVPGDDLDEILARRGPLPEAEVVGWMAQVFAALEYMHSWQDPNTGQLTPAIHRDIKPGNIKLTPQGRIMLVDFGIAKFQGGTGTLTGARAASPGFSPVEQYTGGTDVRTDIYALGATMYCLLTGRIPPEAPELAAGRVQLIAPRALVPGLSATTEGAILRAMQLQSPNRFQSVPELRQALAGGTAIAGPQRTCTQCGAVNRGTAKFCNNCGGPLPATQPPQARPSTPTQVQSTSGATAPPGTGTVFLLKRVTTWCAGGALTGALFGYLPRFFFAESATLVMASFAGALFFGAVGATVGGLIASKAKFDTPEFVPRFTVTLLVALALAGGLGLFVGSLWLGGALGLAPLILGWLGSVMGGIGCARGTETAAFRKIKWG
jgi:hypothetical protein